MANSTVTSMVGVMVYGSFIDLVVYFLFNGECNGLW